jgi:predicted nuclease of predicted toxin-antitoxin system
MKILLDMNLSPDLVKVLATNDFDTVHWSQIGTANASDREIMTWAKNNDYVIVTHDLDFGTILAIYRETAPSVIQIRTQDLLAADFSVLLIDVLRRFTKELKSGALITVEPNRSKVRILPILKM